MKVFISGTKCIHEFDEKVKKIRAIQITAMNQQFAKEYIRQIIRYLQEYKED